MNALDHFSVFWFLTYIVEINAILTSPHTLTLKASDYISFTYDEKYKKYLKLTKVRAPFAIYLILINHFLKF